MDDSRRAIAGRYYIKTFGCQMNEYDSARMGDVLAAVQGMQQTEDPAQADVLLVNTCSVREKAESKVFSLLGEWKQIKDLRPASSSASAVASRVRRASSSSRRHRRSTSFSGRRPCIDCHK